MSRRSGRATPLPSPRRVVLVGFMGVGKSTIGRLLAQRLGWDFCDLDRRVEIRAGQPIAEMFASRGEAAFREEERLAAESLLERSQCVVAAGGGAWHEPATRELLARDSVSVWLQADLPTLQHRLPDNPARPLARDRARMAALFAERQPSYRLADLSVETKDRSPHEIADQVAAYVRARLRGDRQ